MPKTVDRLTALQVSRLVEPGMYADGNGLYLQVTSAEARSWIFRYRLAGRRREMGLGSLAALSLGQAREQAKTCRNLCQQGADPIEARDRTAAEAKAAQAATITFKQAAKGYIQAHRSAWRNAKHAAQWEATLSRYVYPIFGDTSVREVNTGFVMLAIEPIWSTKPETASRIRGRIEVILDWAKVRGHRDGDNPARWRGHLDKMLPRKSKVRAVRHHPALPYDELPVFMTQLRQQEGEGARALEYTILTVARTNETIGAKTDEVAVVKKMWTVPPSRMKAKKEHRVPLSNDALALTGLASGHRAGFIFSGAQAGRPLSNMAMTAVLRRMNRADITVHGFRSTFRDWAAECTGFPNEVVEMALAHSIADETEAAYRRGDLLVKRQKLMDQWARYCNSASQTSGKIITLKR